MKQQFDERLLRDFADQHGMSIHNHSLAAPFLLVLIRHVGCAFCRRTLDELSQSREQIEACGYRIGLVHMDANEDTETQLSAYGLDDLPRFYDPGRKLYQGLGLARASLRSLFKLKMVTDGVQAGFKYGGAWPKADPRQLPGAFLIDDGHVVAGESTLSPHDHPDFLSLLIFSETLN